LTVWSSDFAGAISLIAEADSLAAATGSPMAPLAALSLLARQATSYPFELVDSVWALPELVEAAVRRGEAELARDALERLAESTQPSGTDFGLGIEARSRALLSDGAAADGLYREAIDRLGRTRLRPELARAHLLYGEWLRRENRRVDVREQLRIAHDLFAAIGMEAFAERARIELLATGETARKRTVENQRCADRPGGRDRPAGPRRPVQPGDRHPAVHQRARSSTTWARCSPSWTSARAPSWTGPCPATRPPPGRSSPRRPLGALPGATGLSDWPLADANPGGCERDLAGRRHRVDTAVQPQGPDDRRAVRRLVPAPMRGNGNA
jgi:hypothetical protein